MRCLNFADYLSAAGADIQFICRTMEGMCAEVIQQRGYAVTMLEQDAHFTPDANPALFHANWLETDWQQDAEQTYAMLKEHAPDWVVIDHYALDASWERYIHKKLGCRIVVIDDLADRNHDAAILLDQNYHSNPDRYLDLVPHDCQRFLGPAYALLHKAFFTLTPAPKNHASPKRLFIFFSGVDKTGETLKTLQALSNIEYTFAHVDVVCGSGNADLPAIKRVCEEKHYTLHINTSSMAELIAQADMAIGAGGVNTWERCFLHLPTCVISIAENQEYIAEQCAEAGFIDYLGKSVELSENALMDGIGHFIEDTDKRQRIHTLLQRHFNEHKLQAVIARMGEV